MPLRGQHSGGDPVAPTHQDFLEATLPHLDAVYRLARHASRDAQLAEDLVQETYLRAFAAYDGHRGNTRSWLTTICLNLVRSDWRRRRRRPSEELSACVEDPRVGPLAAGDEVLGAVQSNLDREQVARALAELPLEQRQAIVLMDLVGHTAAEVAELLGCPRGTVLARAHRGRRRLAQLLGAAGGRRDVL